MRSLRYAHRTAVTVGLGPGCRFSVGRLRRGVADNGLFLQIVDRGGPDLPVPETGFPFGRLVAAQAGGVPSSDTAGGGGFYGLIIPGSGRIAHRRLA